MSVGVPRVSVIMAVYNGARDLLTSLPSVLSQDFADIELVIVDDGSTDDTQKIIEHFTDPRIVYYHNEENRGQTGSLNVALGLARGELIARIDADDAYRPGKLARQVAFLDEHPEVHVVGTWARRLNGGGDFVGEFRPPTSPADIAFQVLHASPICHVSAVMRRAALVAVGGYDEEYRYAADYKLWSDLLAAGYKLVNIPEVLMDYRVDEGSFGARTVLGAAGAESGRIIQANAARIGYPLTREEARAIYLRTVLGAGPGMWDRVRTYLQLTELAQRVYGHVPLRVRVRLFAAAVWSLARADRRAIDASGAAQNGRVRRRPDVIAAIALGNLARMLGPDRLLRLREWLSRRN